MKYFFDTEFHEYKRDGVNTIELISLGIVAEDGREYYAESLDFDNNAASQNEWLNENVLAHLWSRQADKKEFNEWIRDGGKGGLLHDSEIAGDIRRFCGDSPEFYAYYADYDWVVFCWLFGRMIDLPEGFPMYCRDLKQMLDDRVAMTWEAVKDSTYGHQGLTVERFKELPNYPVQANEHNALDDAKWNRDLFEWLLSDPAKDLHSDNSAKCPQCGTLRSQVRGRYPGEPRRLVCPQCTQEMLDDCRSQSGPAAAA